MPQNPDEIGALWTKTGQKGEYMTGTINGVNVACFRNDRKQGNQPDWRVMKSKPKEERAAAPQSARHEPIRDEDPGW